MPSPDNPFHLSEQEFQIVNELLAEASWVGLKRLSKERQLERLQTDSSLWTRELFDAMIKAAEEVAPANPRKGEETALLAHALAGLLPQSLCPEAERHDLWSQALVATADCRRLAGDWQGAAEALATARGLLERGARRPAHEARLLSVQASLESDLGHAEEALTLLAQATALYRRAEDPKAVAALAVEEAGVLLSADRFEEAVARAEESLKLLPPEELRLEMQARDIVTEGLVFLARPHQAMRNNMATEQIQIDFGERHYGIQFNYLVAILLDALEETESSERLVRATVQGFLQKERDKEAFQLLLRVLAFHLRRGAPDRAVQACKHAIERIEEAGIEPGAPVQKLWRALLALAEAGRLTGSHLLEAWQYVVRSATARTTLPSWVTGIA